MFDPFRCLQVSTGLASTVFKCSSLAQLFRPRFGTLASKNRSKKSESASIDKALKVLDLVKEKRTSILMEENSRHHRLVHGCLQDLLEGVRRNSSEKRMHPKTSGWEEDRPSDVHTVSTAAKSVKADALLLFVELLKRGIYADSAILSSSVSLCASTRDFDTGVQLHACLVKLGYNTSILIGSSLISLYSKCGQLSDARRAFEWLPERNIFSWTAMIAAYAQHWEVEMCLQLFNWMRRNSLKPNDVTFASLLSACTSSASLLLGRSIHGLEKRMGFNSYTHVSNALISMYAKCGSIAEAEYIFQTMQWKDLVSWNSMISGFSQYGLADQALDMLSKMGKQKISPDAISYLAVLSSCRHAGLIEQGRHCFKMMLEHNIRPDLDHYSCMVDLLSRARLVEEALDFIQKMPSPPNAVIWGSLLSSCRVQEHVRIGIHAAERKLMLEPGCSGTLVQLANLYASIGCWNEVARLRKQIKDRGKKTSPGVSWLEIGDKIYSFKAEDSQVNDILQTLDCLVCHMEDFGCPHFDNFDIEHGNIS